MRIERVVPSYARAAAASTTARVARSADRRKRRLGVDRNLLGQQTLAGMRTRTADDGSRQSDRMDRYASGASTGEATGDSVGRYCVRLDDARASRCVGIEACRLSPASASE